MSKVKLFYNRSNGKVYAQYEKEFYEHKIDGSWAETTPRTPMVSMEYGTWSPMYESFSEWIKENGEKK